MDEKMVERGSRLEELVQSTGWEDGGCWIEWSKCINETRPMPGMKTGVGCRVL